MRHLDYILITRTGDGRWPRYQAKSLACPGCAVVAMITTLTQDCRIGDVANSKRPLLIIPKVQLCLRVTRRSATALARYPQKLAKIVCG